MEYESMWSIKRINIFTLLKLCTQQFLNEPLSFSPGYLTECQRLKPTSLFGLWEILANFNPCHTCNCVKTNNHVTLRWNKLVNPEKGPKSGDFVSSKRDTAKGGRHGKKSGDSPHAPISGDLTCIHLHDKWPNCCVIKCDLDKSLHTYQHSRILREVPGFSLKFSKPPGFTQSTVGRLLSPGIWKCNKLYRFSSQFRLLNTPPFAIR